MRQSTTEKVDRFLDRADAALASLDETSDALTSDAKPFHLQDFADARSMSAVAALQSGHGGDLDITIELGRTQMYRAEIDKLRKGSVVALDDLVGEPVEIFISRELVARGELLVLAGNFCVRVTQLAGRRVLSRCDVTERES